MDAAVKSMWQSRITTQLRESAAVTLRVEDACGDEILRAAQLIVRSLRDGGKLMLCGNGGSAADAQHFAGEFVSMLSKDFHRPPMAAVALTTDTSCLTAIGNDFGYEHVFERQLLALGRPGDVVLVITTSGRSENIVRVVKAAREMGIGTIGLLGQDGGPVHPLVNVAILVPSRDVQRIQEAHGIIEHILCDLAERMLYRNAREVET